MSWVVDWDVDGGAWELGGGVGREERTTPTHDTPEAEHAGRARVFSLRNICT